MTRIALAVAAVCSVLAGSAAAENRSSVYVGALAGSARLTLDDTPAADCKCSVQGLFGGYRFNPYVAVELSYYKPKSLVYDAGFTHEEVDSKFPALSLLLGLPAFNYFSVYARAGTARTKYSTSIDYLNPGDIIGYSFDSSDTKTTFIYGGGLAANCRAWGARIEYSKVDMGDLNGKLLTVGISWSFHP